MTDEILQCKTCWWWDRPEYFREKRCPYCNSDQVRKVEQAELLSNEPAEA